jgi:hypothetical protein
VIPNDPSAVPAPDPEPVAAADADTTALAPADGALAAVDEEDACEQAARVASPASLSAAPVTRSPPRGPQAQPLIYLELISTTNGDGNRP